MSQTFIPAILAACILFQVAFGPGQLAEPQPVSFRLADGTRVRGTVNAWSLDGFDGTFGPRQWKELMSVDAWKIHRRVMDREDPADWINLGRVMLLHRDDKRAESAFAQALRIDAEAGDAILIARDAVALHFMEQQAIQEAAEAERLHTIAPEGRAWPSSPWPSRSQRDQPSAIATMRADGSAILAAAGTGVEIVETRSFIIFAEAPKAESIAWGAELERLVADLRADLQIPADSPVFWGKAVVMVVAERDTFELIEAESFNQLLPRRVQAACHAIGPKVFITAVRRPDVQMLRADLLQQAAHGVLHGYRSPKRLPPWANDGYARATAARVMGNDWPRHPERDAANAFVRNDGVISSILNATYAEGWPGPAGVGPALGQRLVELMLASDSSGFREWIIAVKSSDDVDWVNALKTHYGVAADRLVAHFVQYVRVND